MAYKYIPLKNETEEEIKIRQLEKLKKHIAFAYEHSPFYRERFDKHNLKPENISTLDDLRKIPLTTKEDLRNYNKKLFAAPQSQWIDMNTTSGTTGEPVYMPQTQHDMKNMAIWGAQTLSLSGLNENDTVHLTLPLSARLWAAGFGFYMCFTSLGVCALRFGPGFTGKSLETIQNTGATAIMAVPSYGIRMGIDKKVLNLDLPIKRFFTIGENILEKDLSKNSMGKKLQDLWGAEVYSCYGATEGPFLGVECHKFAGQHMNPDEVYVEILDPETLEPVKDGEEGLVTVTPIGVEGFPLIRYINGDVSFLVPGRCSCGRMLQRLGPIFARKDHMMKIKGVKVYPEVIKKIVEEFEDVDLFQLEAYTGDFMDLLRVYIPHLPAASGENLREKSVERAAILQDKIRRALGVTLEVHSIDREELQKRVKPPEMRKPVVFIDNRNKTE